MSDIDNKQDKKDDTTEEKFRIIVDRSSVEEDLQKQLEKERAERDRVNKELEEATKKLQEMEGTIPEKEEEFTKEKEVLQGEIDKYKGELATIAKNEFDRRKSAYITKFTEIGIPEEKVKEMDEMLQKPTDLDNAEMYLTIYQDMMTKAAKEREEAEKQDLDKKIDQTQKDVASVQKGQQQKGGGVTTLQQTGNKPMVYDTYRDGITDLYKKQRSADADVRDEAKRTLDQLWSMVPGSLRKEQKAFAIAECPRCTGGILQGEHCPYCGFDPATYVQRGNIWSN